MPLTRPTSATSPPGAPAGVVTPPAPTSEAVASGGSVTGWTFSAFTDPDGRIASYSATLTAVVGSGSLSGSGLGPYSLTGTADGDSYTVELDALDSDGAVLATATHSVSVATTALPDPNPLSDGDYIVGGYHDFDGIDDHITFPALAGLELTPSSVFTLSIWVYSTSSSPTNAAVSYGDPGANEGWSFRRFSSDWALLFVDASSNVYTKYVSAATNNQWEHYLVVSDGSAISIYENGVSRSVSTVGSPVTPTYSASSRVVVGAFPTPSGYYDGSLAEIAVWSTDQSANVAAIYNSRNRHDLMNLATPPDVFYASLSSVNDDPGPGGSVAESVSSNDGTGVNMDTADAVGVAVTEVANTQTKTLDLATSTVTTTTTLDVNNATGGTGSSFP